LEWREVLQCEKPARLLGLKRGRGRAVNKVIAQIVRLTFLAHPALLQSVSNVALFTEATYM